MVRQLIKLKCGNVGWIPVEFQLGESEASSANLLVPVLVSSDPTVAEDPIIGFNVVEEVIKGQLKQEQGFKDNDCVADIISSAFDIDSCAANSFIQLIHMRQLVGAP